MAERYGVQPKRFTKEWWPHYWMYYKWHTIASVFAAIIIVSSIVECATNEKYDINVTYTGSAYFPEEHIDMLETEMEKYIEDIDGNGEKNVFMQSLVISNTKETAEMDYAMMTKHDMELTAKTSYLFLYDKAKAQQMLSRDDSADVYVPVDKWYEGDIESVECMKNAGGVSGAVSLKSSTVLKELGIYASDLYIAVKVDYFQEEINVLAQSNAIKVANELLK
jgi:hypothetical protein